MMRRLTALPLTSMRRLMLLVVCLLSLQCSFAQIGIRKEAVEPHLPDSVDLEYYGKKNVWRPLAEIVGLNVGLWAYDKYILKAPGAHVTAASIRRNLVSGFKWDSDMLGTNNFLHPYHGGLYFNAARSNGYNFWQSELFAAAGSLSWELFGECEYPSINDFISTPIGGAVTGEVTFRASDAVLDDRTRGWQRFGREFAAFLISPMRGINRIVTGQAWRVRSTSGHLFGTPPFAFRASLGAKMLVYQKRFSKSGVGGSLQLDLEYGRRFEPTFKPYDYFTMRAELQMIKGQPLLSRLSVKGRLLGRNIYTGKHSSLSVGFYQHYDYFDSDTIDALQKVPYKLGIPASVGAGGMFQHRSSDSWRFDCYLHANAVILAGILSDHYRTNKRNYNWASGFSLKAGINWVFNQRRSSLTVHNEFYRLFTFIGYKKGTILSRQDYRTLNVMGDKSECTFNVTEVRFDTRIYRNLYASLVFENFARITHYRDFPDVATSSQTLRLMLSYKF